MQRLLTAACACLLLIPQALHAQSAFQPGTQAYIIAPSGLNLRKTPDPKGAVLTKLAYGTAVSVADDGKPDAAFSTEGIGGYWAFVKSGAFSGYLFDGYLTSMPAPPKDCGDLPQYVQASFKPAGPEQLEIQPHPEFPEDSIVDRTQPLNPEAVYQERVEPYFIQQRLILPAASTVTEAFVLGRVISPQFRTVRTDVELTASDDDPDLYSGSYQGEANAYGTSPEVYVSLRRSSRGVMEFVSVQLWYEGGSVSMEAGKNGMGETVLTFSYHAD
ncbi:MAG: SH3 domain-containing protein [Bacteroidia bacterium]|nr:SH3 domain-containing protein [Bacteroidia bacterium]